MPKATPKTSAKARRKRRQLTCAHGPRTVVGRSQPRKRSTLHTHSSQGADHSFVIHNGEATHVLVPVDEYEKLIRADMLAGAIAKLDDPASQYVDADDFALELAAERIAKARKAKGLTQKQLGDKLKLPQSQISRIERNPDHTTVRTLKRIARALGVDVSALV